MQPGMAVGYSEQEPRRRGSDPRRLKPSHAISEPGQEAQRRLQGETKAGDICHAWMHSPSLTMGSGDQPVVAFFSLPSFFGDTSGPHNRPFVPSSLFANI